MQEYDSESELFDFWVDQNNKLLSNSLFLSERGDIFSDILYFKHRQGVTALDFSVFEKSHIMNAGEITLTTKEQTHKLCLKDYAKLVVVSSISQKNVSQARVAYSMLVHICGFLNFNASSVLDVTNLEDFHISFLTQNINGDGYFSRISPSSYRATYSTFNLIRTRNKLQELGVFGLLSHNLSKGLFETTLDNACRAVMGISRREFEAGGSFNSLTLELGQYYIDYLKSIYEADYFFTLICQRAIRSISIKFRLDSISDSNIKVRWTKVLADTIQGVFTPNVNKVSGVISRNKLHEAMGEALFEQYQCHFKRVQSLKESNIHRVIKLLGLEMRFDAVEVIRTLMLQKYYPFEAHKEPREVWEGYLRSLDKAAVDKEHLSKVKVDDVYSLMSEIVTANKLCVEDFMRELAQWSQALMGVDKAEYISGLTKEFERVSDAMTSLVVAWLGYRKSEFGFPLTAIHIEPNLDILDNSHIPFRFKLKWVVPKTNGQTKIDREITSQCYQVAAQLKELFQSAEDSPCLYAGTGKHKNKPASSESHLYIDKRVKSNWIKFAFEYLPFLEINELDQLSKKDSTKLTSIEAEKLQWLNAKYDLSSSRSINMLESSAEVRQGVTRLNCTVLADKVSRESFKQTLLEFKNTGKITNPAHKEVVDKYLSNETRQSLANDNIKLDRKTMTDISNELLQDVRYPSPHAFRHIWAEAVLTRYQGDVGAVIRHQFCHLDDSFFMAYLRDKEAKGIVNAARIKVLNSIVDTLLIDSKKVGSEYLGGFSRYVKKAVSLTKPVTASELRALREKITGRVISLKSSHFATCIPREGGESRAKCSELGEINPQNAKPSFCLGCTNALITEGNLKGIWMTLQPIVKESLNEDVMGFMVQHHLPTLRSGYKRIRELQNDRNVESVSKILQFIEKAMTTIEAKLAEEEYLYV